jgi:hypothetical protein
MRFFRFFHNLAFLALILVLNLNAGFAASPPSENQPKPETDVAQIRTKFIAVAQRPEFAQTDEEDIKSSFQNWMSVVFIQISTRWSHFKYAKEMQSLSYLLNSIFVLVSFVALITLFRRLIRRRPRRKRTSDVSVPVENEPDLIGQLLKELNQAESERNWSAAFSASWRHLLIRLQNQKVLPADPSQTNNELMSHLAKQGPQSTQKEIFQTLVIDFDRAIYGHKALRDEDWVVLKKKMNQLSQLFSLPVQG